MSRPSDPSAFVNPTSLHPGAGRPLVDPDLGYACKYRYRRFTPAVYPATGPGTPWRPRKRIDLPMKELAARYEAGARIVDLAAAYGVSTQTIRSRLHGAGVTVRPPGHGRRQSGASS
ncbi:hypothetical protein ACN27G_06090 [Plantactinospora sp. WMMB334]|uniref:hypothetical protein n=1 Tax=Plantactinospora sp. WMMB334 TaxID=3404119 RepID=UPI003B9311AF